MYLSGLVLTGIGVTFIFLGGLGLFRFPDIYDRIQAGTKCTTMGAFSTLLGVGLMQPAWLWKALDNRCIYSRHKPNFQSYAGKSAYKSGVEMADESVVDRAKDFENNEG